MVLEAVVDFVIMIIDRVQLLSLQCYAHDRPAVYDYRFDWWRLADDPYWIEIQNIDLTMLMAPTWYFFDNLHLNHVLMYVIVKYCAGLLKILLEH